MDNKKIEFELSKLVLATFNKIAIWNNSDFDTTKQKSDALKIVSQDVVQNILDELMIGLSVVTTTQVTRGDVIIGDVDAMRDVESFAKTDEQSIMDKLFKKKE